MNIDLNKLESLELRLVQADSAVEHLKQQVSDRRRYVLETRRIAVLTAERSGLPRSLMNLGPRRASAFISAFEADRTGFLARAEAAAPGDIVVDRLRDLAAALEAADSAEQQLAEAEMRRDGLAHTCRTLREFVRQANGAGGPTVPLPTASGVIA